MPTTYTPQMAVHVQNDARRNRAIIPLLGRL